MFYAGDARRFMVFSATRRQRDTGTDSGAGPSITGGNGRGGGAAGREAGTWTVVDSRDVDLPMPTADALILGAGRAQFRVQTTELHPPLRVEPGTSQGTQSHTQGIYRFMYLNLYL